MFILVLFFVMSSKAYHLVKLLSIKTYMNSDIPLETAAIFFSSEPWSKTRYLLGESHGWFHLYGHTRPVRSANLGYKMKKKFLPIMGFEPGTFCLRSELTPSVALLVEIHVSIEHLKMLTAFYLSLHTYTTWKMKQIQKETSTKMYTPF